MASTNKTANLKLNQWVLTDPLLMEDMNEDNRKLDAAAAANPYVKLMDVTTAANAQQIDLDVSGIDLTKYEMVQVFAYNLLSTPAGTLKTLYAKINDGGAYLTSIDGYATTSQAYIGRTYSPSSANLSYTSFLKIELADFPDILPASYYPVSIRCSARWYNADFKIEESGGTKFINTAINTLNFVISDSTFYINSGARFLIYGVKK